MNPNLQILISLQDIDQKISSHQKQIAETPKKIQTLQEELQRSKSAHAERVAHSQELGKQRRASEGEVEMMRAKLSKLKDQLMAVKTNKEYTAMLHEIQMAENQIRGQEDRILEIMEQMEGFDRTLRQSEKEVDAGAKELEAALNCLEAAVPGLEQEVAGLRNERALLEQRVAVDLLVRYRQIADARKGIAVAEARDELCGVCHVRIRPQKFAELRKSENIFFCDSCDRFLFFRETP